MNEEGITLKGWPAIRMFLLLAVTPVLTALIMAFPIQWLVSQVFSTSAIYAVFGIERVNYCRVGAGSRVSILENEDYRAPPICCDPNQVGLALSWAILVFGCFFCSVCSCRPRPSRIAMRPLRTEVCRPFYATKWRPSVP